MRVRVVVGLVAVVAAVVSVLAAGRLTQTATPASRKPAPDFTVSRFSDGRTVSLADLRGKAVLLYFFFPT